MKKRKKTIVVKMLCLFMAVLMLIPTNMSVDAASKKTKKKEYSEYQLINVTEYGADKKGKKDSSAAIQSAINAAASSAVPDGKKGNVVYFPKGTYKISNVVFVRSKVTIVAEENAVIKNTIKADTAFFVRADGATIDGGTWQGNNDAEQMIFKVYGNKKIKIKNATIKNTGVGIHLSNGTVTVDNCTITECINRGVRVVYDSRFNINNSTVTKNGSGYFTEKNKTKLGDLGHGISAKQSKVVASNCKITNNNQCGISLVASTAEVTGCTFQDNYRHGIGTDEKCYIKAKKTKFIHNGYTPNSKTAAMGVSMRDGCQGTFEDCTFRKNNHSGVWMYDKGTKGTFTKCTFEKNGYTQLHIEGYAYTGGKVSVSLNNCTFKNSKYGILKTGRYSLKEKKVKFSNVKTKYWKG